MRIHRSFKIGLAMGVMLVSGGRAADAAAQEQPAAPPGKALQDVLQGKVPQVRVVDPQARVVDPSVQPAPGRIRICNIGGHQGPGRPLVIVDGEELSHGEGHDIDPKRIESIELLKSREAIARYGHRAVDGVILVTTRRP